MKQNNILNLHLGNKEKNSENRPYDFSKFKDLEDFDFDDELIEKFLPIAQELNLSQNSVEALMELALEMSKKQNGILRLNEEFKLKQDIENYYQLAKQDNEIPNHNSSAIKEYMAIADSAYKRFASDKLKEIFEKTGLNYHPELIKMFYKIAELMLEDDTNYFGKPIEEELTPAQILYGKTE